MRHCIEGALAFFERHLHSPRREIDVAGYEQRERALEVDRRVGEGHGDAMLLANAGDEIDAAALAAHAQENDEAARTAEIEGGLARGLRAAGVEDQIEACARETPCLGAAVVACAVDGNRCAELAGEGE